MSRGHGAVQRRILEQLKLNTNDPADDDARDAELAFASWTTVLDLAGEGATRAQIESTRRAVLKLAAEGLVETRHIFGRGRERPMRSSRMCTYGDPYGRLYPVHGEGATTSPWLLAARLSVEDAAMSETPQHLSPADAAAYVVGGDTTVSVENADFSGASQHLGQPESVRRLTDSRREDAAAYNTTVSVDNVTPGGASQHLSPAATPGPTQPDVAVTSVANTHSGEPVTDVTDESPPTGDSPAVGIGGSR